MRRRATLYSNSRQPPAAPVETRAQPQAVSRQLYKRHRKSLLIVAGAAFVLAATSLHAVLAPTAPAITAQDVDAAVARALESRPLPSPAVKAYGAVRNSIVRVRASGEDGSPAAVGS